MIEAIVEAKKGLAEGGIPIGSVLVKGGKIVGRGHNQRVQKGQPYTSRRNRLSRKCGQNWQLQRHCALLYFNALLPLFRCSCTIWHKKNNSRRIKNISGEVLKFMKSHGVEVTDLNNEECIRLMTDFIEANPKVWNEDIGKL